MADGPYSLRDAERDLAGAFTKGVPDGAASGTWTATTVQADVSSMTGGYVDAAGEHIPETIGQNSIVTDAIEAAMRRLQDAGSLAGRNKVVVLWRCSGGQVVLTTEFDPDIVPRGPDDPIYAQAAAVRRAFWQAVGDVAPGYLAETAKANVHGQTDWFGPHRRVVLVRRASGTLLATDGLSTPWAGIPDRQNGVECEVCLDLADPAVGGEAGPERLETWAKALIWVGDAVADGYQVAHSVAADGPEASFKLGMDWAPAVRLILSTAEDAAFTPSAMESLPFGGIRLLTATPVLPADLAGLDIEGRDAPEAARTALRRRAARMSAPR